MAGIAPDLERFMELDAVYCMRMTKKRLERTP